MVFRRSTVPAGEKLPLLSGGNQVKNRRKLQPDICPNHRTQAGGTPRATNCVENSNRQKGVVSMSLCTTKVLPSPAQMAEKSEVLTRIEKINVEADRTCLRKKKAF